MKSEVLLSLVILFVAFQPFPGARCQEDIHQAGALADESDEDRRFERQAKAFVEVFKEHAEPGDRFRRNSPTKEAPPYPHPPHPESLPHQGYPTPQKIIERFRRFAKGTGALPQRKG